MDATVAWNYVDLRFRAKADVQIWCELTSDELVVTLRAPTGSPKSPHPLRVVPTDAGPRSCDTCGAATCFRHRAQSETRVARAFLVDERWPEYEALVKETRETGDLLLTPMDGSRWKRPAYAWSDPDRTALWETLQSSRRMRAVSEQGAARQTELLARAEGLAKRYGAWLPASVGEVDVYQAILPFLWRDGALGGRPFRVLMTRLPMAEIHRRLDEAVERFPDRKLLGDFRAPDWLVRLEQEALAAAAQIITPHAEIASLFGRRAKLLPWAPAKPAEWKPGAAIGFPGPTVARKGAFEVREAARKLDLEVVLGGSELEGSEFWAGIRTRRGNVLDDVFAVVQPAFLEDRPRTLLSALAAGAPVVASRACGISETNGLSLIEPGDPDGLTKAIQALRR